MATNLSGVWLFNPERSTLRGATPKRMTVTIDHREPHISKHVQSTTADGKEQETTFEFTVGAETVNIVQGMAVRTTARWQDDELMIESWMKTPARELHFKDFWSISDDGLTVTMAHRNDDLHGQISVLERQITPD